MKRASDRRRFDWQNLFFQLLLVSALLGAVLWLTIRLSVVTVPILAGLFIAYALNPIVVRLRKWRVPSYLALTVPVLALVGFAVLFVTIVLPGIANQVLVASQQAPGRIYNQILRVDPWFLAQFGQPLSGLVAYENLSGMVQSVATELFGPARSAVGWLLLSARDLMLALGNLVLVVVVAFLMLDDYERIVRTCSDLVPRKDIDRVRRIVRRIDQMLAGFVRGELLLLGLAMVAFTTGLSLLDVPFAPLVGPVVAVLYLVPYVGILAGTVMSLALSFMADHSALQVAGVAAVFIGFYAVDLVFVTPRIIGSRVGLRPLAVLLGIVAFGELFGVVGVMIAIPVLATARIVLLEAIEHYRSSPAYLGQPEVTEESEQPSPIDLSEARSRHADGNRS